MHNYPPVSEMRMQSAVKKSAEWVKNDDGRWTRPQPTDRFRSVHAIRLSVSGATARFLGRVEAISRGLLCHSYQALIKAARPVIIETRSHLVLRSEFVLAANVETQSRTKWLQRRRTARIRSAQHKVKLLHRQSQSREHRLGPALPACTSEPSQEPHKCQKAQRPSGVSSLVSSS